MQNIVVIVAGGKGERMGANVPKQFLELQGTPILMHTINNFYKFNKDFIIRLVLPKSQVELWKDLCKKHNFNLPIEIYEGGDNRFQSVTNGIVNLPASSLVGIHDGVRPLVSHTTINNCYFAAEQFGAAIPVISPVESIRYRDKEESKPVDRSKYVLIQTPQVFKSEILTEAYNTEYQEWFTDDASVVEHAGHKIHLIEGNRENIKITSPIDLKIGEALMGL